MPGLCVHLSVEKLLCPSDEEMLHINLVLFSKLDFNTTYSPRPFWDMYIVVVDVQWNLCIKTTQETHYS